MNIDKMIEQWKKKHSSLLDEYSKGNANNEVMQMYRSQMNNVLDIIDQLKQVKNCFISDLSVSDLDIYEASVGENVDLLRKEGFIQGAKWLRKKLQLHSH